jgi:hypothetical protein
MALSRNHTTIIKFWRCLHDRIHIFSIINAIYILFHISNVPVSAAKRHSIDVGHFFNDPISGQPKGLCLTWLKCTLDMHALMHSHLLNLIVATNKINKCECTSVYTGSVHFSEFKHGQSVILRWVGNFFFKLYVYLHSFLLEI